MNADLAEILDELGPEYKALVRELKSAAELEPSRPLAVVAPRRWWLRAPGLAAASVVAVLGVAATLVRGTAHEASASTPGSGSPTAYTLAFEDSDACAVEEIVRTQNADGSWSNDYLTRQNAAALKNVASARVAYRRAVRYLRAKGLSPLTDEEFRDRRAMLHG